MLVVKVMHSVPRNKTNQSLKAEKEPECSKRKFITIQLCFFIEHTRYEVTSEHPASPRVVNILVIHWLPRNYGDVNKPLPRAAPSGLVRLLP